MNCEHRREQMALALYGELEDSEAAELAAHIETCADCLGFEAELAGGLGRIASEAASAMPPLPPLEPATTATSRRAHWIGIAASFAAGLVIAPLLRSGETDAPQSTRAHETFERASPPPPATGGGQLARLGYLIGQ